MVVVGQSGAADCRPPIWRADGGRVGLAHAVANVVVITDGIEGLPFGVLGATLQQLRVEDHFFDVGVHIELIGQRAPHALDSAPVDRSLCLQVVQPGELLAEPVMIGEDQHGDVSHSDSRSTDLYGVRPSCPTHPNRSTRGIRRHGTRVALRLRSVNQTPTR